MVDTRRIAAFGMGFAAIAVIMAFTDGAPEPLLGLLGYLILILLSAGMLIAVGRLVFRRNLSRGMAFAVGASFLIRLVVGLLLLRGLPLYGYDESPQRAGYVFQDAFQRDRTAWELADSDRPIAAAFNEEVDSDIYGGTLALSALTYRLFGFGIHRPLLIVVLSAAFSALAVLLTWAFVELTFGTASARIASWIVALYPDAVLLGASQMREPYLIAALAALLYGFARLREGSLDVGTVGISLGSAALAMLISPPFALSLISLVFLAWIWERRQRNSLAPVPIILTIFAIVLLMVLIGRAWSGISSLEGSIVTVIKDWWLNAGGDWRVATAGGQSYWMDNVLNVLPDVVRLPFLVFFGLLYPFLPAAIFDPALPLWRTIGILRGLGWYILLPWLLYASVAAVRRAGWRSLPSFLTVIVWVSALVSSYRAPGYLWDNPRYRAVFIALQAALAGWAYIQSRRDGSPWFRRTFLATLFALIFFSQWYAGRYYATPKLGLVPTLIGSAAVVILYLAGSAWRDRIKAG